MNRIEGVDKVAADFSSRAKAILADDYTEQDIMKSAMNDFKGMGSMAGIMAVMTTGKLTEQQTVLIERIAVKALAILGLRESLKGGTTEN